MPLITAFDRWIAQQLGISNLFVARGIRLRIEAAGLDEWQAKALPWDEARDLVSDTEDKLEAALERLRIGEPQDYDEGDVERLQEQQEQVTLFLVRAHYARLGRYRQGLATCLRVHDAHPEWTVEQVTSHARGLDSALHQHARYKRVRDVLRQGWGFARSVLIADQKPTKPGYERRGRVEVVTTGMGDAYVGAPHGGTRRPRRIRSPRDPGFVIADGVHVPARVLSSPGRSRLGALTPQTQVWRAFYPADAKLQRIQRGDINP